MRFLLKKAWLSYRVICHRRARLSMPVILLKDGKVFFLIALYIIYHLLYKSIPRIDSLILNAGCIPLVGLNFAVGNFVDFLMRPSWVLTTGGNFMKQSLGQVTKDGLGFAFAANVFGHYIMVIFFNVIFSNLLQKVSRTGGLAILVHFTGGIASIMDFIIVWFYRKVQLKRYPRD